MTSDKHPAALMMARRGIASGAKRRAAMSMMKVKMA